MAKVLSHYLRGNVSLAFTKNAYQNKHRLKEKESKYV